MLYLFLFIAVFILNYETVIGQETLTSAPIRDTQEFSAHAMKHDTNIAFRHCLRLGGSLIQGDIFTTYSDALAGMMMSVGYQYQFTGTIGIEASIHILESSGIGTGIGSAGQPSRNPPFGFAIYQGYSLANSVNGTFSFVWNPFTTTSTDWSNLAVGIGIAARSAGMLYVKTTIVPDSQRIESRFTRQFALGGCGFVQYTVPLGADIDLGFRAESQVYLPPLSVIGEPIALWQPGLDFGKFQTSNYTALGALGMGVFLRLKF